MKIGILTQPLHNNYGGILQNYALQQILTRSGHQPQTIDWGKSNGLRSALYRLKIRILSLLRPSKYARLKYLPTKREQAIISRNQNAFIQKYINRTRTLCSREAFAKQASAGAYQAYIVGSDQCWRPCFNVFLSSMFLDFVQDRNDVRRMAYAASFGTDEWEFTPEQTAQCRPLAAKFDMVTVREDSGVQLCRDHLGVDAIQVLDPTMLLTKEDYIALIEAENEPKSPGKLFNYILDPTEKKTAFIRRAEQHTGLKSFQVLPKCQVETRTRDDVKHRIEDCVFPSVTAWLRAFHDAEMTIVDSFHGMVFSILFNKPFWVIANPRRGTTRLTSLLRLFHLEDRLLPADRLDSLDPAELSREIDWGRVNGILERERERCLRIICDWAGSDKL